MALGASTIGVGQTTSATATVRDASGTILSGYVVAWTSSNPAIATVSATSGLVTGIGAGSVLVTATTGTKSGYATIVVTQPPVSLAGGTIYSDAVRAAFPGGPNTDEIVALNPNTGAETNLSKNPGSDLGPSVSPNGQYLLFFSNRNTLNMQRQVYEPLIMNKDGTSVTQLPYPCDNFFVGTGICAGGVRWLADGHLRYFIQRAGSNPIDYLVGTLLPLNGAPTAVIVQSGAAGVAGLGSPDGTRYAGTGTDAALYAAAFPGGPWIQLAPPCLFTSTCTQNPVWSPNGQFLYVVRQGAIWEFAVSGGASRQLYATAGVMSNLAVSPDGFSLAFIEGLNDGYPGGYVRILALTGNPAPRAVFQPISQDPEQPIAADDALAWSPDSKSLAFLVGNRGIGANTLDAVNADGTGLKHVATVGYNRSGISWGP